jgi:RHS repeat-associated protein
MTNNTGYYGQQYVETAAESGKTYTFSAYVKTNGFNNVAQGAWIGITCDNGGTSYTVTSSAVKNDGDWQKLEVSYTVPTAQSHLHFNVYCGNQGTAYFDCLQAGEGKTGMSGNFIENADFTNAGSVTGSAFMWTGENLTASDIRTTQADGRTPLDSNSFKINGQFATQKRIYQTVGLKGNVGDSYTISSWAKAFAVPLVFTNTPSTDKDFAIKVKVIKDTSDTSEIDEKTYRFAFNDQQYDWQYMADTFTTEYKYTGIEVSLVYSNQCNTAYFDGVELCKENFGDSYVYDANGNLVSSIDKNGGTTSITYDINNNPLTKTDPLGHTTDFNYNSNNLLETSTSPLNVVNYYSYDNFGNTLLHKITDNTKSIETNISYDTNGNYIDKVTDPLGNETDYNYNTKYGTLDDVIDPNGKETSYIYDSVNQLTGVSKDVTGLYNTSGATTVTNSYSYLDSNDNNTDKLRKITHNSFDYNFNYDEFGNMTDVSVGSQNIVHNIFDTSNAYGNNTNNLLQKLFGNNKYITYTYDDQNKLKSVRYNGDSNDRYSYNYDNTYTLVNKTDNINNLFTNYTYDSAGRISLTTENGINARNYIHSFGRLYNSSGIGNALLETINGIAFRTDYGYNYDGQLTDSIFNFGTNKGKKGINYDSLGRIASTSLNKIDSNNNSATIGWTNYGYKDMADFKTTQQISSLNLLGGTGGNSYDWMYNYTYDKNGNIKTISKNGITKYIYTYDELNQMTRVDDSNAGTTTKYVYDVGGNIRTKAVYSYTTDEDLSGKTPTSTKSYTYNSTWKDKLASYDGKSITYDNIGNPLTYDGWTFSWIGGRQLSGMSKIGTTTSYKYNDSGIRTQKTVNSVVTDYTLIEDRVTAETNGTDTIYYRYDGNNDLISMNLNGTEYFYLRNLQNDIIGIVDDNGTVVVQYLYDSWGKLLSIKDGTGNNIAHRDSSDVLIYDNPNHVGAKNPYLYRGYRYDTETGLFYVGSRYYNPEIGRFINADDTGILQLTQGELLSHNMFAYCVNNPVMKSDPSGYCPQWLIQVGIGMVLGAAQYVIYLFARYWYKSFKDKLKMWSWRDFLFSVLAGGLLGLLGPYYKLLDRILVPVVAKIAFLVGAAVAGSIVYWIGRAVNYGRID